VTWLTQPVLVLGGGWTGLTAPVLAWVLISGLATARFLPQVRRSWRSYLRNLRARTNGGTVATAALEQAVAHSFALGICVLCLAAAVLAGHRERASVLPLLVIPVVQLVRAEVSARVHDQLMRALKARGY
jgi:hypothetical protein